MMRHLTAVFCIAAIAAMVVFPFAAVHFLLPLATLGTFILFSEIPPRTV
jgi:hypothetical protein